ncbi:MAG: right-handed parallel beta-helix repeat-containing protein [Pseudoxanthomonas sp.]
MATIYVDPSAAGPGDGTLSNPFTAWTSVNWSPGNTYLQKRRTTYAGVFRPGASGTRQQRITIGAYARADGSDDPSQPRPVILLPSSPVTPQEGASIAVFGQERDFITYRNLDIRNPALPEASDVAIIWLGNGSIVENIVLTSNCAGVYVFEKSGVTISACVLDVLSCSAEYANHGILVAGNTAIDDIRILGNSIVHRGGGSPVSYGIRCEAYRREAPLTRLLVRGNRVTPPPGETYSTNRGAVGIYLVNGLAAQLDRNTVSGMLSGIRISSGERNRVSHNNCSANMNFGIHVTGFARSFLIEGNTCNRNGGAASPSFWGRGIELSGAAGPGAVSGHTIRRNTCMFNYNFGGPLDNGSEGVGIGLDDGVLRCAVLSNQLSFNEGNGIQLYGGPPGSRPDTGGHTISGNVLNTNCTHAVLDRRSGGSAPSPFYAHIQLATIYGSPSFITSNFMVGPTRGDVHLDSTSSNVTVRNNIYWRTPSPLAAAGPGQVGVAALAPSASRTPG